jgi:serine/threonine protein kinase
MQEAFGDYRILEPIARSETVHAYRARDTRSGRTVAIKVLTSPRLRDPVLRRQVLGEAQAASALSHPNIATLYEIGEHDDQPYLVFEFVQGQLLGAVIAGRPLNARRAIEYAIETADALADAHASGLIHQAISPDTIVLNAKGHAKTLDFGTGSYLIAVAPGAPGRGGPDAAMPCWAPEQRAGATATVVHRADIYALGLVLIEMLTGQRWPIGAAPPGNLSGDVDGIIRKMIAEQPHRRFDSAATLAAELRQTAAAIDTRPAVVAAPRAVPVRPAGGPGWILFGFAVAIAVALLWFAARLW